METGEKNLIIEYIKKGWSSFPVQIETFLDPKDSKVVKKPHFPNKDGREAWGHFRTERITEDKIDWEWIVMEHVGICTGKESGITVVDVDDPNVKLPDDFPETYTVQSKKGFHYYFKYEPSAQQTQDAKKEDGTLLGIDIRNDGGFVFAPPTKYKLPDKTEFEYKILKNISLAPFPIDWYRKTFNQTNNNWKDKIQNPIQVGSRNMDFASIIGGLLSKFSPDEWETMVWSVVSDKNKLQERPLSGTELRTIFNSISKKELSRRQNPSEEDDVVIRRLSEVKAKPIDWIINPMLAKGKLTIFHGDPGKGKSQASIYIASEISRGGTYFDGQKIEEGEVLFITSEDEASDTLKPRLMACGANVHNIVELRWIVKKDGKIKMFNLEEHVPQLRKAVEQLPNLRLIIIDPISAFLGKVDGNSGGVRGLFAEIKPITEERGCALLVIAHNNKTSNMKALNKISGNGAFGAATRIAYLFGDNPLHQIIDDGDGKFIMAQSKNNLLKQEDKSQIYDIESAEVEEDGVAINTSRIKWLGVSDIKSQEVVDYMPNKKTNGRPDGKKQECIDEIENFMGERTKLTIAETKTLKSHLSSSGFDEQMQRRARQDLNIQSIVVNNEPFWQKDEGNNLFNTQK